MLSREIIWAERWGRRRIYANQMGKNGLIRVFFMVICVSYEKLWPMIFKSHMTSNLKWFELEVDVTIDDGISDLYREIVDLYEEILD